MKLGRTDLVHNVTVRVFGGTDMSTRWDRCARVRVKPQLGLTDYTNLVGPIWVISEIESWPSKLGGTNFIFR